jgi:hypothetical protein
MPETRLAALLLGVALTCPVAASTSADAGEQDLFSKLDAALFPPLAIEASPSVGPEDSCEAIYLELNRLIPLTRYERPGFFENPVNAVIGAVGVSFPPAFHLWSVPAYQRARAGRETDWAKTRVAELRQISAAKSCWAR